MARRSKKMNEKTKKIFLTLALGAAAYFLWSTFGSKKAGAAALSPGGGGGTGGGGSTGGGGTVYCTGNTSQINLLQKLLISKGYSKVVVDGKVGPNTTAAVESILNKSVGMQSICANPLSYYNAISFGLAF
jgi:hypothetical protein